MPLRLIIEDDEGTTTIVPLESEAITIGRQQGNTIQLTEKNVSRRHARLFPDAANWVIEDLNSYNGVKVNGQAIDGRVQLTEGDVVQIGDYHLALTEDVDKRTLNFDDRGAANDGTEPLLVSSSTDLPRLSPDELAALQSGPQTPQPSAMLLDSGPMPATAAAYPEERRSSGAGALIGAAVVVVLLVTGGLVWMAGSGNDEPNKPEVATAKAAGPDAEAKSPQNQPLAQADPNPVAPVQDSSATPDTPVEPVEPDTPTEAAPEQPENADPDPVAENPEPTQADPEPPKPDRNKSKPRRNKSKPRNDTTSPKPAVEDPPAPPPPEPEVDADALLDQARKALFKNPGGAYKLAQQSFQAKRSQDALVVMAMSACRMGDSGKAKRAASKIRSDKNKSIVADACSRQGIEI